MEEKQMEIADELAASEREIGLSNARKALAPQHSDDFDGVHCIDCGTNIPEIRLLSRRIRCTECETIVEKKAKRGW